MADELDEFITALTTVLESMTGIIDAPEHPPEGINEFPFVVCYLAQGRFSYGTDSPTIGVHTVHADVHIARSMLPSDEEASRPYILRGLAAIAGNVRMSSTCEHCLLRSYQYGQLNYGDQKTMGVRLVMEVKIKHSGITVQA